MDSDKVFIEYVLKQFEHLEQKRSGGDFTKPSPPSGSSTSNMTSSSSSSSVSSSNPVSCTAASMYYDERSSGSDILAKCYMVDLHETFDSETLVSDPLSPFDIDTQLNRLHAQLNSPNSAFSTLTSSLRRSAMSTVYASHVEQWSSTPLVSNLYAKHQEHQRGHLILPKLFDFLILLSHEKIQQQVPASNSRSNTAVRMVSTSFVSVPEIIQMCDNLIASENSPQTHAIPALRPLVIDLFLHRTFSADESIRELEMQQDVVMVTMLRLIHYPQVFFWFFFSCCYRFIVILKFFDDK